MEKYVNMIYEALKDKESLSSEELSIPTKELHGVLLSMQSKNQIVFELKEKFIKILTEEGKDTAENGSQEFLFFNEIGLEGESLDLLDKYPLGSKYAFKNKWIKKENGKLFKNIDNVDDKIAELLRNLSIVEEKDFNELKRRKLVEVCKSNEYIITKGPEFGISENFETELTAELVQNFQNQTFKKYNFNSTGNIPICGSLHPLLKIREEFKNIFIEMGFTEMRTNRYVESSFWNFDSLFQPQCHPARDAHDTFFLKTPEYSEEPNKEYLEEVKNMHENGGYGSIGHKSIWSVEESMKNVLRTHTTACSARYLKGMAKDFKPCKLFSIDKVFRNESVDATHLAEFHQVEGVIAGYNLSLCDLMGFMSDFYKKLGLTNIKFKPAFNPYTEPSMEVFGFHEGLKKWIEIGNSGMFRPEMLRPMGLGENVTVIGYGLSLERPAMIKYGLNNIRDLSGHKVDINFIKKCEFIFLK